MNRQKPSNDPRMLVPRQNAASPSQQQFNGAGSSDGQENRFADLGFEDLASTAPKAVQRSLHNKHQRNTLARINQQNLAITRTVPVVIKFNRNNPGEVRIAANPYAMGTDSISNEGQRVLHDLRHSVVYDAKMDAVNMSQDTVGLKLNAVRGTIFPNTTEHPDSQEGYNAVLLPGETVSNVPLHISRETNNHAKLARRMLGALDINQIDMDKDLTVHSDMNTGTSYAAVNPGSKLASKLQSMAFHPEDNPRGQFLITNRERIPDEYADKRVIRTNGMTKQLLVDAKDMDYVREMLGGKPATDEEKFQDAQAGWMDLSNLKLKASVVPSGDEDTVGDAYDTGSDAMQAVHARITVRYVPLGAAAAHAGDALASEIKSKIAGSSGTRN